MSDRPDQMTPVLCFLVLVNRSHSNPGLGAIFVYVAYLFVQTGFLSKGVDF